MRRSIKKWSTLLLTGALLLQPMGAAGIAQAAKKVSMSPKKLTMTVGTKKTIKLRNNKKRVTWSVVSGKTKVKLTAKKKTSVKVTAKKKGTAKVLAKVGKKKHLCKITIKAKKGTASPKPATSPGTAPEIQATLTPSTAPTAPYTAAPAVTPTVVPTLAPMVEKDASTVATEMGMGWNLGNTMEAYEANNCEKITYTWIPEVGSNTPTDYETCWKAPVTTQAMIDGVKAAGFDTVRIPVFWGNMMKNDGTYTVNPDYIARVKEIVNYCQNAGLYAVINMHHFDEFIIRRNSLEECKPIISHIWTQIAQAFQEYPETLVFEGFNEYLGGSQFDASGKLVDQSAKDAYEMTNTLNQTFVDAVRSTGGNNAKRVLVVSGYWTNIDNTTKADFKIPTDTAENKLMVSVHYIDNQMYWENKIGGQDWLDYIDDQCGKLKTAFTDKGIPVFVGETTSRYGTGNMVSGAQYNTSTKCLEYLLTTAKQYGFVTVLWDTDSNFYSRSQCRVKSSADREMILRLKGITE